MSEPAYLRVRDVDPARWKGVLHIDFRDRFVWVYQHLDHPQFGASKSTPRRRGASTIGYSVVGCEETFETLRDAIAAWNRRLRDAAQENPGEPREPPDNPSPPDRCDDEAAAA